MNTTLTVFAAALMYGLPLCGQTDGTPPPGDPDVYRAFFRMYDRLVNSPVEEVASGAATVATQGSSATNRSAASSEAARKAAARWQRRLGLNDADFAVLNKCSEQLKADLERLATEALAYRDAVAAQKQAPDPAKLSDFRSRQLSVARGSMESLKREMTPGGAASLFRFIEGEFRASMKTVTIGGR
jgi:hypothetical protein